MARRILIAEDNEKIGSSLKTLLAGRGFAVEIARDGVEAMQRIAASVPDLLLLDLRLPRLHGVEVLKKLRRSPRTRHLPVIISTGAYRGDEHRRAAAGLGVTCYLEKPYRADQLLAAVGKSLPETGPEKTTFDRHLVRAFRDRFSGSCRLHCDDGEKTLLFLDGSPFSLRPGFRHRDFGDYLRERGLISAEEYTYYAGNGEYRHETLVQMGCLEFPELLQENLTYLTGELVEAFGSPAMAAEMDPFPAPPSLQMISVNIPEIFHRGFRSQPQLPAIERLLTQRRDHYVGCAESFFRYINFFTLEDGEKLLLTRLDGSRTLADCLQGDREQAPLAMTLASLGMIHFATAPVNAARQGGFPLRVFFNAVEEEMEVDLADDPLENFADLAAAEEEAVMAVSATPHAETEPDHSSLAEKVRHTHAGLEGKSYYEIFDLDPGSFAIDALKERYFALTREYGPEILMHLSGEEAGLVEAILDRIATAYNTLSDVVRKERYDELLGSEKVGLGQKGDDRFQAQVQSQSGKVFIEMEEWESAEKALQDACNIDPNSGDYLAHLAWAIYRNPKNARSQAMLAKAKQMLNRAITMERTSEAFAFKGWMLFEGGQESLAEGEFNKALKLNARQLLARQGLRTIRERREQEKKGLFRKMFR